MNKEKLGQQNIGYLFILCAGTLWGFIGLFVKLMGGVGADSSATSFIRIFMGSVILLPVLLLMSKKFGRNMFKLNKAGFVQCLLLGVFSQALFNACYSRSINSVGVATASVLLYTAPIFVCIMSVIAFREKIGPRKGIALVINFLGCFIMATGGDVASLKLSVLGIFFGVAAGFLYGTVTIIGKFAGENNHPITTTFYSFLFGWITLAIFTNPFGRIASLSSPKFWLIAFLFGLIPTVGSYFFYMNGLSKITELSRAPIIASVEPVIATLIGIFMFHENVGFINIVGLVIVLLSIVLMNTGKEQHEQKEQTHA